MMKNTKVSEFGFNHDEIFIFDNVTMSKVQV
jgi:hypothetical protein